MIIFFLVMVFVVFIIWCLVVGLIEMLFKVLGLAAMATILVAAIIGLVNTLKKSKNDKK